MEQSTDATKSKKRRRRREAKPVADPIPLIEEEGVVGGEEPTKRARDENEERERAIDPGDRALSLVMMATAIPQESDSRFLYQVLEDPQEFRVASADHQTASLDMLEQQMALIAGNVTLEERLFVAMINEGNFIELMCELTRQQQQEQSLAIRAWQRLAVAALASNRSSQFHFLRPRILRQPFLSLEGESRQDLIDQAKAAVMYLSELDLSLAQKLNWDALAYKVSPSAGEFFLQMRDDGLQALSATQMAIVDQIQKRVGELLRAKIAEYRQRQEQFATINRGMRTQTPSYSDFLESRIAANEVSNEDRQAQIASFGNVTLVRYLQFILPLLMQGLLPGGIAPAAITACHDVVTGSELRATIMCLAEQQIILKDEQQPKDNIRVAMVTKALDGDSRTQELRNSWTVKQTASINQGRFMDSQLARLAQGNFRRTDLQPDREIEHQVAGGAASLYDSTRVARDEELLQMGFEQEELLRQSISVLLACLRVRFLAVQQSNQHRTRGPWELVPQADLDHLIICEQLAANIKDPRSMQIITELAATMQESVLRGHNQLHMMEMFGEQEEQSHQDSLIQIKEECEDYVRKATANIGFFAEGEGETLAQLMSHIYLALANEDRLERELEGRLERRRITFAAFDSYL